MDCSDLFLNGSAADIGAAIRARATTSEEATGWYLERIARLDATASGLNAVRSVSSVALACARAADAEISGGQFRGPLHGVPYLLKDNIFSIDGCTAAAGARAFADFLPPYEATLVSRLKDAGAILLGKTNLTEFADFVSDVMPSEFSGAGGVVRNPLGPRYDRGQGSSVGSAAAVAARLCAFAVGSETQNSIQAPATFSSVVGFKPTAGRVSRHGVVPLVPSQDSPGPLAICVADAALVYRVMEGADVHDTASLRWFAGETPVDAPSLAGLRIGVPRRRVADGVLTAQRAPAFEATLAALAKAGAVIVDPCDLPSAQQLHDVRSIVFRAEFKEALNAMLTALRPCGISNLQELIAWNASQPDAIPYGQSLLEAANATEGVRNAQYVLDRQRDVMLSVDQGIVAAMRLAEADVLLSPMTAAAKCTGKAGCPVVAIPIGADANGAPFGITLYSEPGSDARLLRIAEMIEGVVGQRLVPSFD